MDGGDSQTIVAALRNISGHKVTVFANVDFDKSNEDVFDEEAEDARAGHLTNSTININTGEKVSCQLDDGMTMG